MKKYISFLMSFLLILSMIPVQVFAADGDPKFFYELTVDGSDTKEVRTGDIITVTLHLYRTDADEPYSMYAMQDEIRYDSEFFELVQGSALLAAGVQSTDIGLVDSHREFYMNYVSFSGGKKWDPKTRVGSFQLKVVGTSGVSTITNEDYLVSLQDGSGSYPCEANTLTVILTTDCTVRFETNGGSKIDSIAAIYGETLTKPADPVRAGKRFVGWYKDIHLTEAWDFTSDTVTGNMTLYAKWETVTPDPTDPPHAHTWRDATCTEPKICTVCQATEGKPLGHDEVKHEGKAATCTVKGWEPYVTCSRCDYSTYKEIAPVGHMETTLPAVAPTCTEDGLTSGIKCLACDIIIQKQEIIPATGHKFEDGTCVICGADDPNHAKPTEPKPTEPKPTEPKPTEPKPTEPKPTEPNVPEDTAVKRVYGENRYETSLKVAEELRKSLGVDKFDTVIVASGTSFADALSGSALAIQKNAPILVTNPFNEAKIQEYIKKTLKPNGTVYILGGESAVPGSFEKGLAGSSFTIKRLAGEDRYETNLKILLEIGVEAGDEVLVCTGKTFADSLSASATGKPILLVRGDYKLFYNQMLFLNARGTENKFVIIGGENAVSTKLEAELKEYGTIQRIGGENRFETSVLLAERFFENPDSAVLAYARKFPDGLCGGPLAYRMQAPLILTQTGREEQADAYAETNKINEGYVLGGDGLISDGSAMKIFNTSKVVVVK